MVERGVLSIVLSLFFSSAFAPGDDGTPAAAPLSFEVKLERVLQSWDGVYDWAQAWAGSIPGAGRDGAPRILITTQKENNKSDDFYLGVNTLQSDDFGATWTGPTPHPEMEPKKQPDETVKGLCDFTSGWHASTGKFLITGHTVFYANGRLAPRPYPRTTAYAVYDPKTNTWQPWRELELPDKEKFFNSGSGMCQWVLKLDGTLLLPVYYMPKLESESGCYSVTILHCAFDGETLKHLGHGDELKLDVPRGFCEPSLTFHRGRYYLTLRNDVMGYVTSGTDGQHFDPVRPWTFDDGAELGSYNTMQHWATHSDGLFLVYTRRGANNDHVIRNRAPLFIAQVDPEKLCVLRATERIVVPDRGASLGNFGVANVSDRETWITVGECMYSPECEKRGSDGTLFAARILWSAPNTLVDGRQPIPR